MAVEIKELDQQKQLHLETSGYPSAATCQNRAFRVKHEGIGRFGFSLPFAYSHPSCQKASVLKPLALIGPSLDWPWVTGPDQ